MPLSVIAIGDPHFKVDNIQEVDMFIEKIEKLCLEKQPDIIICLGDLLHTHERLHTTPLNKAYEFIERMRKITLTYVIVGNHDYIQNQQFLTDNHWMNGMKEWTDVIIVDKVIHDKQKGIKIALTPYVPPGRFEEALNTNPDNWKDVNCIFAHQEFYGCKMGAIVSVEGDRWDLNNPLVVSGHIHSKQTPQPNIYYTGSAMQHAFGESEKNIIAFITYNEDKSYNIEEIDLQLPRKKIIYMNMDNINTYSVKEKNDDDIKITLTGNYDEFKAFKKSEKYKQLTDDGTKVVFKVKKEKEKKDETQSSNCDFKKNLYDLISSDVQMLEFYELIINNKI